MIYIVSLISLLYSYSILPFLKHGALHLNSMKMKADVFSQLSDIVVSQLSQHFLSSLMLLSPEYQVKGNMFSKPKHISKTRHLSREGR